MYDFSSLLSFHREAAGIFLKRCAIQHKEAGKGVLAGCPMAAGDI